jgi:hypothetical protein
MTPCRAQNQPAKSKDRSAPRAGGLPEARSLLFSSRVVASAARRRSGKQRCNITPGRRGSRQPGTCSRATSPSLSTITSGYRPRARRARWQKVPRACTRRAPPSSSDWLPRERSRPQSGKNGLTSLPLGVDNTDGSGKNEEPERVCRCKDNPGSGHEHGTGNQHAPPSDPIGSRGEVPRNDGVPDECQGQQDADLDASGGPFWLGGSFRISANEQVEFLRGLYERGLRLSAGRLSHQTFCTGSTLHNRVPFQAKPRSRHFGSVVSHPRILRRWRVCRPIGVPDAPSVPQDAPLWRPSLDAVDCHSVRPKCSGYAAGRRVKSVKTAWANAVLKAHGTEPLRENNGKPRTQRQRELAAIEFHDLRRESGSRSSSTAWRPSTCRRFLITRI